MNRCIRLFTLAALLLPLAGSLMLESTSQAQSGPVGEWTNTVNNLSNSVWDITALYYVTNVDSRIVGTFLAQAETQYTMDPFDLDGRGKASGIGTNTIKLGYQVQPGVWTNIPPFPGTYQMSGSITGARGVMRGLLSYSTVGQVVLSGKLRTFHSAQKIPFTFSLGATNTWSGTFNDSVSASGLSPASSRRAFGPYFLDSAMPGTGVWTLTMTLSTTNQNITGSAEVALDSGRTLDFGVKGIFKSTTQQSRLVLTSNPVGSVLQVGMSSNVVTSIKGKIFGQQVNVSY